MEPEKIYDLLAGDKFWQIHRGRYVFVESRHNDLCELLLGKRILVKAKRYHFIAFCMIHAKRGLVKARSYFL